MHKDISSFDFENSQDFYINEVYGVIVIDMSGKIRYMNKQCMNLIGYTDPTYQQAKELFGRSVEDVFPYTHMLENLAPEITKPKIVFYKSNFGMGISMNVPLIYNGEKIGRMEYDLVNEEKITDEKLDELMTANLKEINQQLPAYSQLNTYKLYNEEFEKTPKRSIKRFLYQ